MEFGELKSVNLREAWPHEAHDFTPWLADNLGRLSDVIGIPLESEGTEVAVNQFAADILARNPADGSRVLIENQLAHTDHTHLGQILTYLAGLEAQTVIWVAQGFDEAHLSAIRWLNEHTVDPFAFFAVRVRVVRIGDDPKLPVAPLFEVLERPSGWDRQVRAMAQEPNERTAQLRQFRSDFWQSYCQRYPDDLNLRPGFKDSNVYHRIGGVVVSQYLAQGQVGIYLRAPSGDGSEETAQLVQIYTDALNTELGIRRVLTQPFNANDRDNWPEMVDWLHEQLGEFRRVIEQSGAANGDE